MTDPNSVEMLRVWIAEQSLWCSIKVSMYRDLVNVAEEKAWRIILADATRHLATALAEEYGTNPADTIRLVRQSFLSELDKPTSEAEGSFA